MNSDEKVINMFKKFMNADAKYMYITGAAGTGKTTTLANSVQYCVDNGIAHKVCAFTHKAVDILAEKMPAKAQLATLHSHIKKIPTVNSLATKLAHVDSNAIVGKATEVRVLFVDEFSMIGKQDFEDIEALNTKVVFLGDLNQLPPVGDTHVITPEGEYHINLTHIYRQAGDNQLLDTLGDLVNSIETGGLPKLTPHKSFTVGADLKDAYLKAKNVVLLAFTNERVQELNAIMQGYEDPKPQDKLFCPSLNKFCTFNGSKADVPVEVVCPGFKTVDNKSKFNELGVLKGLNNVFFANIGFDDDEYWVAAVFGHKSYLEAKAVLKNRAARSNKNITNVYSCADAKSWAMANRSHPMAQARAKAWREFLAFNSCVVCLDFAHAMTVHKSQGSTYETVVLDKKDLLKAGKYKYSFYLRLLYVAISRASKEVFMN